MPDYTISLRTYDGFVQNILATTAIGAGESSFPNGNDNWITETITHQTDSSPNGEGSPLRICLKAESNNVPNQVNFDNVRLSTGVDECTAPPAEESVTLDLGPGWDQQGTLTDGSVVIQNSDSPNWIVEFNLEGGPASTNFSHHGLDVFVDSCPVTPLSFGDVTQLTCGTFTRDGESGGETHTVIVYSLGALTTDGSGDGSSSTEILGITDGPYDIEFWIGGSVNYQSDGNENGLFGFGDTKTFVIPP